MTPLGPFEPNPHVAVAVSGGRDSMALALATSDWARARGGRVTGLIVDHGLRPESAAEARQALRWLRAHGIAAKILLWRGAKPERVVQAAARSARYALLEGWCRAAGVLYLLLAHQQDDQAETFLLRLGRGSGLDGLCAMAAVVERSHVRLLRPLLGVPRADLTAFLRTRGQAWIDDPSNENAEHARARLRSALPALASDGLAVRRLATTAASLGAARRLVEAEVAALMARAVSPDPAGFLRLDGRALAATSGEVALRAMARCLVTVGGASHPPRLEALQRLYQAVAGGLDRARTLAGCGILPWRGEVLVAREAAAVGADVILHPGEEDRWDGRFHVAVANDAPRGLCLRPLGTQGWRAITPEVRADLRRSAPLGAHATLPSIWRADRLLAVPHAEWVRDTRTGAKTSGIRLRFMPDRPLVASLFGIASRLPGHYV